MKRQGTGDCREVKLFCMKLQWRIRVIRHLCKPTECTPRVSPHVNYGLQFVLECQYRLTGRTKYTALLHGVPNKEKCGGRWSTWELSIFTTSFSIKLNPPKRSLLIYYECQETVRKHSCLCPFSPPHAQRYARSVFTGSAAEKLTSIFMLGAPSLGVCPGCFSSYSIWHCTNALVYYMLERNSAMAACLLLSRFGMGRTKRFRETLHPPREPVRKR